MMRSGQLAANNVIVPLATYGALPADIDRVKAAKWICFASNTLGGDNQAGVATVLKLIHQNNLRLDSIVNLRLINAAINSIGGGGPAPASGVLPYRQAEFRAARWEHGCSRSH